GRARRGDRPRQGPDAAGCLFQHAAVDEREGGWARSVHARLLALLSDQASSRGSAAAHARAHAWRFGGHPAGQPRARQPWQSGARGSGGERSASFADHHPRARRPSVFLVARAMIGRTAIIVAGVAPLLTPSTP